MSPAANLLSALIAGGASLWAEGDQLRYRGPSEFFSTGIVAEMRLHKAELLTLLRSRAVAPAERAAQFVRCMRMLEALGVGLAEVDHYFERAAIMEVDGNQPRDQAELAAATEALRVHLASSHGGFA